MLPALAFVPVDMIIVAFEVLCDSDIIPSEAVEVVNYFEDMWIGRPARRNVRRPPYFPHKMWNMHQEILDTLPKTNNAVEGWHRSFETQVAACHPNIWKFIECIKREQAYNEVQIEQLLSGANSGISKKRYRDTAERLRNIAKSFNADRILEYLGFVSNNLAF